ncbi:MAG: TOBE domain-containing protein [Chloroflexi bacterium]|nr:TOBE domain-containing protein [Chloroflexota bacterium]
MSEHLPGIIREAVYIGTDTRYVVGLATGEAVVVRTQNVGGQGYGAFQVGEAVTVWWRLTDARLLAA